MATLPGQIFLHQLNQRVLVKCKPSYKAIILAKTLYTQYEPKQTLCQINDGILQAGRKVLLTNEFAISAPLMQKRTSTRFQTRQYPVTCIECGSQFDSSREYKLHLKTHIEEKPFDAEVRPLPEGVPPPTGATPKNNARLVW